MRTPYQEAFDHVTASERLKKEVLDMTKQEKEVLRRRIPKLVLIAAVIVLLLAGTALAVNMPHIQDWFHQYWEETTGEPTMAPQQEDVMDHLTQSVDASANAETPEKDGAPETEPWEGNSPQTEDSPTPTDKAPTSAGGPTLPSAAAQSVTVSLDSVAVGESNLWMLVHVTGSYEPGKMYTFAGTNLSGAPEKEFAELGITVGGGIKYQRGGSQILSDGSLQIMIRYQSPDPTADLTQGGTYQLHLEDLMMDDTLVQEGQWDISFTLDAATSLPCVDLEHVSLPVSGLENVESVDFEEIHVTSTGVKLVCQSQYAGYNLWPDVALVLADGTEIPCDGARASWEGETDVSRWIANFSWKMPVSLEQAAALRFSDTVVPLR